MEIIWPPWTDFFVMLVAYGSCVCLAYIRIQRPKELYGKNVLYAVPGLVAVIYMIVMDMIRYNTTGFYFGEYVWFGLHCIAAGIMGYVVYRSVDDYVR